MNRIVLLLLLLVSFSSVSIAQQAQTSLPLDYPSILRGGGPDTILNISRIDTAESFDFSNNNWTKVWTRVYEYNTGNQLLQTVENKISNTALDYRRTFVYNSEKSVVEMVVEEGNASANTWTNSMRVVYEYDQDNRETLQVVQHYINNTWEEIEKTVNEYNGIQHVYTAYYNYDDTANQWIKESEIKWEYIVGLKMRGYHIVYQGTISDTLEMYQFSFDGDGDQDSTITLRKDSNTQTFVNYSLTSRTFLNYQQIKDEIISLWDTSNYTWMANVQHKYIYNTSNELLRDSTLNYVNNAWQKSNVIIYKRSPIVIFSSINERSNESGWILYPIPASNELFIEFENDKSFSAVSIFNQNGKLVQQYNLNSPLKRLDISKLTAGNYFLQLSDSKTTTTKSFIKID